MYKPIRSRKKGALELSLARREVRRISCCYYSYLLADVTGNAWRLSLSLPELSRLKLSCSSE